MSFGWGSTLNSEDHVDDAGWPRPFREIVIIFIDRCTGPLLGRCDRMQTRKQMRGRSEHVCQHVHIRLCFTQRCMGRTQLERVPP